MLRLRRWPLLVVLLLLLAPRPAAGAGVSPPNVTADPCPEPNNGIASACSLGQPNAVGTTVQGLFSQPNDLDVYRFEVPAPGAQATISLTDLWYPGSLQIYDLGRGTLVAESARQGQDQGQLYSPQLISRWLDAGSYGAFVAPGQADWASAEAHSYTLRVALGPRAAGQGSARGYQLALAIEPNDPSEFSLMTFSATLNPPFTDLFDFSWTVDGQPFGDNAAVVQLPRPASGSHSVQVVARGARPYPDPSFPEFPPTLTASGNFQVR
jgi:hypothetical protein